MGKSYVICVTVVLSLLLMHCHTQSKHRTDHVAQTSNDYQGVYEASVPHSDGRTKEIVLTIKADSVAYYHSIVRGVPTEIVDTHTQVWVDSNTLVLSLPMYTPQAYLITENGLLPLDPNGHPIPNEAQTAEQPALQRDSKHTPEIPQRHWYRSSDGQEIALYFMNDLYIDNYIQLRLEGRAAEPLFFVKYKGDMLKYANERFSLLIDDKREQVTLWGEGYDGNYSMSAPLDVDHQSNDGEKITVRYRWVE